MRKGATGLIILLAGLAAPAASAQTRTLPTGEARGVIVKQSGKSIVITFRREAAQAFKVIAGRRIDVACTAVGEARPTGTTVVETTTKRLRAPKRRRSFRVAHSPPNAYCVIARSRFTRRTGGKVTVFPSRRVATVPLTQRGAVYLDERRKFADLFNAAQAAETVADEENGGRYPPAPDIARRIRRAVALPSADARPPAGRIGVFSTGTGFTVATLSAAGRRLYIQVEPDRYSTNAPEQSSSRSDPYQPACRR